MAEEALSLIGTIYRIEGKIEGRPPAERLVARQTRSRKTGRGVGGDAAPDEAAVHQGELFDPPPQSPADAAMTWAVEHLSERDAVFARTDLLAAALAWKPGSVAIGEAEAAAARLEKEGALHASGLPQWGESLTTDRAVADEKETVALMERGQGASRPVMRSWIVGPLLHNGRLTVGQKEAVKTVLSSKDRVVGVQGYAGTGKTTMLARARQLAARSGYRTIGVAPSASAARTLASEAGIETETLQRFLARNAGVAEGRLTRKGARDMRAAFRKTVLVVDEGSLASTVQARDLLRIAAAIRIPRVVLVGDSKQLDAVDAGKPFAQLQAAGMKTAVMDEILRQKDADLKEAVRASLAGEIGRAFGKLRDRIRWTRNDTGLRLVNSDTAEVASVRGDRVAFRLGDGRMLELGRDDPQMRHLDHAWASTVHAFQGRTVDNVIAVMEANHPKLSTQKSFYVEISRARHNAELVTDDAKALRETLEAATGERVSALEGIGAAEKARGRGLEGMPERPAGTRDETQDKGRKLQPEPEMMPEPKQQSVEMGLGL